MVTEGSGRTQEAAPQVSSPGRSVRRREGVESQTKVPGCLGRARTRRGVVRGRG